VYLAICLVSTITHWVLMTLGLSTGGGCSKTGLCSFVLALTGYSAPKMYCKILFFIFNVKVHIQFVSRLLSNGFMNSEVLVSTNLLDA
jgi:hypothetical protein